MVPVLNLFIGFVLKVVTMLILMRIPSINIQGAAVSTVICYAFAGIADTIYMMRRTKLPLRAFDLFGKPIVASLAMGGVVYIIYGFIAKGGHENLATLFSVVIGVCVYALLIIVLRMFSAEELDFIPGGSKLRAIMYKNRQAN